MPNNELDDFIDEIDETIAANSIEKPLAKGVATQHSINQRPEEMTPKTYAILTGESDAEVEFSPEVRATQENWVGSIFRQLLRRYWYKVRCEQCNFRFASRKFESEDTNIFQLACLHSHRNQHKVSVLLGDVTALTIEPRVAR